MPTHYCPSNPCPICHPGLRDISDDLIGYRGRGPVYTGDPLPGYHSWKEEMESWRTAQQDSVADMAMAGAMRRQQEVAAARQRWTVLEEENRRLRELTLLVMPPSVLPGQVFANDPSKVEVDWLLLNDWALFLVLVAAGIVLAVIA